MQSTRQMTLLNLHDIAIGQTHQPIVPLTVRDNSLDVDSKGASWYAALHWQKEANDIPSKFELWMFSYFACCILLPGQILCINTHPAKKYVR